MEQLLDIVMRHMAGLIALFALGLILRTGRWWS